MLRVCWRLFSTNTVHRAAKPALFLTLIALLSSTTLQSAQAQFWFFGDSEDPRYRRLAPATRAPVRREPAIKQAPRRTREAERTSAQVSTAKVSRPKVAKNTDDEVGVKPTVPLYAVVSIEDQHVSIYGGNGLIERSDISTGTESHPTPTGIFAIIQKERWHESNLYSGAPMPFMQRITWSGVAMHTGQLPGYPASHGCIRLPNSFAERWFGMTKLGLRVMIAPTDVVPEPFAHAKLPVPRYWTVPGVAGFRKPVQSAALSNEGLAAFAVSNDLVVNPIGYAAIEKQNAKLDLKRAEQAESDADDALEVANKNLKETAAKLKTAEKDATAAQERMAWFGLLGNRAPPSPRANFGDGVMVARANYEASNSRLGEASRAHADAKFSVAQAAEAARIADGRTERLKSRIVEMGRRQETVSIFISRKDERIYVRQALRPVLDIPIHIRDADLPIGNHVFVASAPVAGNRALQWTALTMPIEVVPKVRSKRTRDIETGSIATAIPSESAAGALDRLQLSGEVMDQLAEYVWAGASIIISDHGITHETGIGTDFIIETKH
jgi:lipoprotein-anchoring transpeptidase ErfK/SrfK